MIIWGGVSGIGFLDTGGRYNPSIDTWIATSTGTNTPSARYQHTAVWTDTQMIVWGGISVSNDLNTGGRYNPSTDSWTPTSTGAIVPVARAYHTAVWAGAEMIIWGGVSSSGNNDLSTGSRYDPASDRCAVAAAKLTSPWQRPFSTHTLACRFPI